jgi:hypothetical protein
MSYASISLKNFLNEDLGNLKPIADMPKEWKQKLIANYRAGANSVVTTMDATESTAKVTKFLKDEDRIATIVKVDGQTKYYIEKISPQKYKISDADQEYSIRKPREEKARAERDAAWKKQEEERQARYAASQKPTSESISNPPKVDEVLNERRGRHDWHDPAELGEYSTGGIIDFLKKLTDAGKKVELLNISKDKKRSEINTARGNRPRDPLEKMGGNYDRGVNPAGKKRFEKYEEKKKAEIDKKVDIEIEKFKEQILDNFDKSMEEILQSMRKGYGTIDAKSIGEKLLKGVDLNGLKRFQAAYELIGNQYREIKPKEVIDQLKRLGFGPKKRANESLSANVGMWDAQFEDAVSDWLHEIHDALQDLFAYSEREAQYLMVAGQNLLEKYWKLKKTGKEAAAILAKDIAFNNEAKAKIIEDDAAQGNYDEMVAKHTTLKDFQTAEQSDAPDFSKMDKFEIQKEIDKALDAGDYETLEKLKKYIPESLQESIQELLKEVNMETINEEQDAPSNIMEISAWVKGVFISLIQDFEMEEDEAGDFIDIVHDELKAAFEDGLLPEEAAALVYSNEEALEKLAQLDPGYQEDFEDENEPTGTTQANRQDPGFEYEY